MKARYDDQKDRGDEIRSLRYEPFESQWTANRTHLQLLAEQDDAAGLRELLCTAAGFVQVVVSGCAF